MKFFLFVCFLGFIVGLSGGVEWGTFEAGLSAFVTILISAFVTAAYASEATL